MLGFRNYFNIVRSACIHQIAEPLEGSGFIWILNCGPSETGACNFKFKLTAVHLANFSLDTCLASYHSPDNSPHWSEGYSTNRCATKSTLGRTLHIADLMDITVLCKTRYSPFNRS